MKIPSPMTYEECLEYMYEQLPMFHRIGNAAFNKSLDNILALCEALDNPQHKFKSVHVAGTNGKGSSSNMLAAILQNSGYKTGLYTSPHLKDFTERIRINGLQIPKEKVVQFVEQHKELFAKIQPSFFEMTVALAFEHFVEEEVDIAVIEVGLGGRLDSTNIITPEVCLITNISFDHQSILGETLQEIAAEKAGIIKENVPVIISQTQAETVAVFEEKAREMHAPIVFADKHLDVINPDVNMDARIFDVYKGDMVFLSNLELGLLGSYQEFNLPGVLMTVEELRKKGYDISEYNIREGLKYVEEITGFKGRWQVLQENPLMICDTGHNEAGMKAVLAQIERLNLPKVHFVFGAVNDKDITKILQLLPSEFTYYFCQANIPRALLVDDLFKQAKSTGLSGQKYNSVMEAVHAAKATAKENELIFIGGSTFVVAEVDDL
ncbi:bifunctional folylpolyglutamate synthase/dihydrofolate synthase [Adhaeribacter terreus]|uniref:Dihydrofolate synthase/folylpolyglutamate synthase n=1 Tax=Adhaeribacter terreus TaxID=529703 RepID=A0ABW0EB44_9BACT